ncbi:MAG: EcoRII N-terminal effector-binding domain-containing protein [Porticoccaceae bacterium]|nr:EcoRII N-terminal effector-binding domain-containing protein [Porticoccaceae bacterium]
MNQSYEKVLTPNDTGETGGHQAGIAVPKQDLELIAFFPQLATETFNPDRWITCIDPDEQLWEMRFVFYNGKTFRPRKSTRNEYRITHMTKFFSKWNARSGDSVIFTSTKQEGNYRVSIKKTLAEDANINKPVVLRGWKAVY